MPTILVADDNSNIQKMVGIALKDHGITVVAVGNGEAAVRKMAESLPDLILADIFMPVRNGYEVCEYVKKDDRFAHIPVVLLVGAFDPLDEKEVERVHADGVLKKPFVPPDPLIELVKSLLGKTADAAAAATASAGPGETQELEPEEDVERTQDLMPGIAAHSPTGTLRMPIQEVPPVERTQRLTPETVERSGSGTIEMPRPELAPSEPPARTGSGTVEVSRPEIPPPGQTQHAAPQGSPVSAENFRLDLDEPPAPPAPLEETQKLSVRDISDILKRESALTIPAPPEAEEHAEEFETPAAAVDFHGGEAPVAFEDMLRPTEDGEEGEEAAEEEEQSRRSDLGLAAFQAAEEHGAAQEAESPEVEEERDEAEVRFGGIREEAKTPDPVLPPIPVDFGHSEPVEIITEEHQESSDVHVGSAEDLVTSSSGWAASTGSGEPHAGSAGEPGLMSGGAGPTPTTPPVHEFTIPPEPAAESPTPAEFEETSELPKHILQEEVTRAQEIAARVAAQNREYMAREEAQAPSASPSLRGPGIEHVISAADTILARHRAQLAEAEVASASAALTASESLAAAAPPPSAAPVAAPPVASQVDDLSPTVTVPKLAHPEDMIEAISERVLAQLDPYIIEKISKEIVRPIVEAMIRRELEKME